MAFSAETITDRTATDDTIYYFETVSGAISIAGFRPLRDGKLILGNVFGSTGIGIQSMEAYSGSLLQEYSGYETYSIAADGAGWENFETIRRAYRISDHSGYRVISVYSRNGIASVDLVYSDGEILIVSDQPEKLAVTLAAADKVSVETIAAADWTAADGVYTLELTHAPAFLNVFRENRSVWCDVEITENSVIIKSIEPFSGYAVFCNSNCFTEKIYSIAADWSIVAGIYMLILSGVPTGTYRLRNAAEGLSETGTELGIKFLQRWEDLVVEIWNAYYNDSIPSRTFLPRIAVNDDHYLITAYEDHYTLQHAPSEIIQAGTRLDATWFTTMFERINELMTAVFSEVTTFAMQDRIAENDDQYEITVVDADRIQFTHLAGTVTQNGTELNALLLQAVEDAIIRLANEVL